MLVSPDILPDGVKLIQIDPSCAIETVSAKTVIKCDLGAVEPKARGRIILDVMSEMPLTKEQFKVPEINTSV
jgi:hypothetical protein